MKKSSFVAVIAACVLAVLAGPAVAQQREEAVSVFPNAKDGMVLDELAIKQVKLMTVLRESDGKPGGAVPAHAVAHKWVVDVLTKTGYRLSGADADPTLMIEVECYERRCSATAWLLRDVYLRQVVDGRQFFIRLPSTAVAEFGDEVTNDAPDEAVAQRNATFAAIRGALQKFSLAVIEANHPDALAKQQRLFEQPLSAPTAVKPSKRPAKH